MENLQIFKGHKVEILNFNGQILFNPYDIAEILDIKNIRDNLKNMNSNQLIKLTNSKVGNSDIRKLHTTGENFLTESGVYKLIFKSNKPKAEEFANWVTDEVLPSIRQTGSYGIQNNDVINMLVASQKNIIEMIRTLSKTVDIFSKSLDIQNRAKSIQGSVSKPKRTRPLLIQTLPKDTIRLIDTMLLSETYTYKDISDILKSMGYDIGRYAIARYNKKVLQGVK